MMTRNPHGPTTTPSQERSARIWVVALKVIFVLGVILVVSWAWPWPKVDAGTQTTLITKTVTPGGELVFERDYVCIPKGMTVVRRIIQSEPDEFGNQRGIEFDTLVIDQNKASCQRPNITRLFIPEYAVPGRQYRIELVSTTENPTIWRGETITYSPWFTVVAP